MDNKVLSLFKPKQVKTVSLFLLATFLLTSTFKSDFYFMIIVMLLVYLIIGFTYSLHLIMKNKKINLSISILLFIGFCSFLFVRVIENQHYKDTNALYWLLGIIEIYSFAFLISSSFVLIIILFRKLTKGKVIFKKDDKIIKEPEQPFLSSLADINQKKADYGDIKKNSEIIEKELDSWGVKAHVKQVNCGPTITQYVVKPLNNKTKFYESEPVFLNLSLALSSQIRIVQSPDDSELIDIEVANKRPEIVSLKTMIKEYLKTGLKYKLPIMLGVDSLGKPRFADLVDLKHILIAGGTGSGKSVFENSLIVSLMLLVPQTEIKFIMVDMKRVELSIYNGSPFILGKVMMEAEEVISNLKLLIKEKERRLNLKKEKKDFPYIIVAIDTFSDLMFPYPGEFEKLIVELTKDTKDSKIHIVACDSRPSLNIFTLPIRKSFPTRLVGNTSSVNDSLVALEMTGAERMLGRGDMLFLQPDKDKPIRIQVPWISEKEVLALVKSLK